MNARRLLALTFDDGPSPDTTLPLLALCREYQIPASFFTLGQLLTEETAPIVRQACAQGCEIGNHSFSHPDMSRMNRQEILAEVSQTSERIAAITGNAPRFFRPPYIAVSEEMFRSIPMTFIGGYGCDDFDPAVSVEARVQRMLAQVRDGAVLLLHDLKGNRQTVETVRILIPALLEQGYAFTTVSGLFNEMKIVPKPRVVYSYAEQTAMYG